MKSLYVFCLVVGSALILAGCGPGGPTTYQVSGTVTFDGTPVADGDIIFRDAAGQEKSYGGKIAAGKYSFESSPGNKKVEITAMRQVPGEWDTTSNPGSKEPLMEQYIPAQYNTESTLTAEVSSGTKTIPFDLKGEGSQE